MTSTVAATVAERESQVVRALSARWLEAVDARDAQRIAGFYADDGAFFVPNAPPAYGSEHVRAVWMQLLGAPNLFLRWTPSVVDVAQAGDVAYEIGTYRLGMDGPAGRIEDDGKYVVVWGKRGREWKVVVDIFNSNRAI